jgi:hypothetical protein
VRPLLLQRDYIETAKWTSLHYYARDGSYRQLLHEIKKDNPNPQKIKEYVTNLEYLRFMLSDTGDLAIEVLKMAKR